MADLRLYDFDFNLLHIENKVVSANWSLYYNKIGKAEIHLPNSSDILSCLFDNKYLLATYGDLQAIVTGKQIGKECVIYGRTPNWILSRRVHPPFSEVYENVQTLFCNLAKKMFSDVENFEVINDKTIKVSEYVSNERYESLSALFEKYLEKCALGYKVELDINRKKWIFSVYKGEKKDLVLSEASLNCYNLEYLFDMQNYFSQGMYLKSGQDDEKEPISIVKDEKNGIYKWIAPLYVDNEIEARKEIDKYKIDEEISAKTKKVIYNEDYSLGDIVTLQIEKGNFKRAKEAKIDGVYIWAEKGNVGQMPIFKEE